MSKAGTKAMRGLCGLGLLGMFLVAMGAGCGGMDPADFQGEGTQLANDDATLATQSDALETPVEAGGAEPDYCAGGGWWNQQRCQACGGRWRETQVCSWLWGCGGSGQFACYGVNCVLCRQMTEE